MEPVEIGQGQIRAYADEAVSKEEIPKYLDAAARFPQMPWYNILLTFKQMPEAEILCGIRAWKKYGAALRRGEKPVMLLSPVAVRHGDIGGGISDGFDGGIPDGEILCKGFCGNGTVDGRTSESGAVDRNGTKSELGMGAVGVYDIAQVKLAVNVPMLEMPRLDGSLEDALRGRCGLVIMEDRDGSFLRSRAVRSCFSREERTVYIRPGLSDEARDVELVKCYAKYAVEKSVVDAESHGNSDKGSRMAAGSKEGRGNPEGTESRADSENMGNMKKNGDAAGCVDAQRDGGTVRGMVREYRDLTEDYLAYILCKYFHLPEYPLRVVSSGLFGETAERKEKFLCGLSALAFGSVKELSGKKILGFNETMFCNLFFTEPDRERVLENLERFKVSGKTVDGIIAPDLYAFRRNVGREDIFSDGEIKGIYEKRLARELFSFPPAIYGE